MAVLESEEEFLKKKWYVVVDDLAGGFAISTVDKPLSKHDFRNGEAH